MAHSTHPTTAPEQLALLSPGDVSLQFRLDQRTRERGLAHIAAIKAQLAAKAEARQADAAPAVTRPSVPVRRAA
ncbi:MAG: hypothetical protein Q8M22_18650 [Actinomycetota bacterium]|nr:hypothetical protein [Actinomycetota bacterium]